MFVNQGPIDTCIQFWPYSSNSIYLSYLMFNVNYSKWTILFSSKGQLFNFNYLLKINDFHWNLLYWINLTLYNCPDGYVWNGKKPTVDTVLELDSHLCVICNERKRLIYTICNLVRAWIRENHRDHE